VRSLCIAPERSRILRLFGGALGHQLQLTARLGCPSSESCLARGGLRFRSALRRGNRRGEKYALGSELNSSNEWCTHKWEAHWFRKACICEVSRAPAAGHSCSSRLRSAPKGYEIEVMKSLPRRLRPNQKRGTREWRIHFGLLAPEGNEKFRQQPPRTPAHSTRKSVIWCDQSRRVPGPSSPFLGPRASAFRPNSSIMIARRAQVASSSRWGRVWGSENWPVSECRRSSSLALARHSSSTENWRPHVKRHDLAPNQANSQTDNAPRAEITIEDFRLITLGTAWLRKRGCVSFCALTHPYPRPDAANLRGGPNRPAPPY